MMLLIATQSPFVKALPLHTNGASIILTQDAVIAVSQGLSNADFDKVYALSDDITARGLNELVGDNIEVIDYQQFVQLTLSHHPIVSW